MKKIFSITVISLLLSGCLNSVTLPNSNTSNTASEFNQNSLLTEEETNTIRLGYAIAFVCINTEPKQQADKWDKSDSLLNALNESERAKLRGGIMVDVMTPYLVKNQIPVTPDNWKRLFNAFKQDKKLFDGVLAVAKEALPTYGFGSDCSSSTLSSSSTLNNVKQVVKNIMVTKNR